MAAPGDLPHQSRMDLSTIVMAASGAGRAVEWIRRAGATPVSDDSSVTGQRGYRVLHINDFCKYISIVNTFLLASDACEI